MQCDPVEPVPGRILLLNGSSSAGKTTLALALQELLDGPWQHMALDHFRDGMAPRYRGLNSPPGTPGHSGLNVVPVDLDGERVTAIRFGDVGRRVLRGMHLGMCAWAYVYVCVRACGRACVRACIRACTFS